MRVKAVLPLPAPLMSTGETAIAMPLDGAAELTERTYVTAAVTVTAAVPTALA